MSYDGSNQKRAEVAPGTKRNIAAGHDHAQDPWLYIGPGVYLGPEARFALRIHAHVEEGGALGDVDGERGFRPQGELPDGFHVFTQQSSHEFSGEFFKLVPDRIIAPLHGHDRLNLCPESLYLCY